MEPRWSDLMQELVEAILMRLPTEDYRQVGLVCKSWRSATINVRRLFKPPPLLILTPRHFIDPHDTDPAREPGPIRFYAVCRGGKPRRLRMRLDPTAWCCGSLMGWLLMADVDDTSRVHLLNPISGERVGLPPLPPRVALLSGSDYVLCSAPALDRDCLVAVYGSRAASTWGLFTCRPSDRRWGEIPFCKFRNRAAFCHGRLYVSDGHVTETYDFAPAPRKTGSVTRSVTLDDGCIKNLVVVDGKLLLLPYRAPHRVYELVDGRWAEARGPGDWVLIRNRLKTEAFSMRERPTSGFEANCVYEPAGYSLEGCSMGSGRLWSISLTRADIESYKLTSHHRGRVSLFLPHSW